MSRCLTISADDIPFLNGLLAVLSRGVADGLMFDEFRMRLPLDLARQGLPCLARPMSGFDTSGRAVKFSKKAE